MKTEEQKIKERENLCQKNKKKQLRERRRKLLGRAGKIFDEIDKINKQLGPPRGREISPETIEELRKLPRGRRRYRIQQIAFYAGIQPERVIGWIQNYYGFFTGVKIGQKDQGKD